MNERTIDRTNEATEGSKPTTKVVGTATRARETVSEVGGGQARDAVAETENLICSL